MPIPRECRKLKPLQEFGFQESTYERPNQKWVCGRMASGNPCRVGPDGRGNCQASFECEPSKSGDTWQCTRPQSGGGKCEAGPHPDGTCCQAIPPCTPELSARTKRGWVAKWAATLAVGFVALIVTFTGDTRLLTPGPMTTSHGALSKCAVCHSTVPEGQFGWLHVIFATVDPRKGSEACLSCHSMENTALNPHGLALDELEKRTRQVQSTAAAVHVPISLRVSKSVVPVEKALAEGVFCTTCHKEHRGEQFDLTALSNTQCQTCHAVQFDSFAEGHPKLGNYPFDRRTRINFDHGSHFNKHFPDTRKKANASAAVPGVCADCHTTDPQRRHMVVRKFESMCSSCHLGQIAGMEVASGPQGVALLTLPGLDVDGLREVNAAIGQWPPEPFDLENEISPLMKLLIGSDAQGKKLLDDVSALDLLALEEATAEEVAVVEKFVWTVKGLIYAFSTSKMSEMEALKKLSSATSESGMNRSLLARLLASIPRDVWVGAQRDWFPDLQAEIALRRSGTPVPMPGSDAPGEDAGTDPSQGETTDAGGLEQTDPLGGDETDPMSEDDADPLGGDETDPMSEDGADPLGGDETDTASDDGADPLGGDETDTASDDGADPLGGDETDPMSDDDADPLGGDETDPMSDDDADPLGGEETDTASDDGADPLSAEDTDTASEDETTDAEQTSPDTQTAAIDAEAWAEFGGWYRHNFAIRYKPTDHADRFMVAWLDYTGHLIGKPEMSIATPVFEMLTGKFAPGKCTKCHSVDAQADATRTVNWKPLTVPDKRGRLTRFSHEPHFSIMDDRGCLTCHALNPEADYQTTYKSNDPTVFTSNFKPVERLLCASCHTKSGVGDDCQLCHAYHATGIETRNMATTTKSE